MAETSDEERKRLVHTISGCVGWFLVNGLIWLLLGEDVMVIGVLLFLANLVILIVLAANRSTHWIALGVLIAWAFNFIFHWPSGRFSTGCV